MILSFCVSYLCGEIMEITKVDVKSAHTGWGLSIRKLADFRNPHIGLRGESLNLYNPNREGMKILRKPASQITYNDLSSAFVVPSVHIPHANNNDGDVQDMFRTLDIVADTFFPVARQMYARQLNMPKRDHGVILNIDRDMGMLISQPKIGAPRNTKKPKGPPRPR